MKKNPAIEALVQQALKHEFTKVDEFVDALACHSTLENSGQGSDYRLTLTTKVERVFQASYGAFAGDCEMEGVDMDKEFKTWERKAKKIADTLQKKKLPLTVENGNHVFFKTGPFAKKKK